MPTQRKKTGGRSYTFRNNGILYRYNPKGGSILDILRSKKLGSLLRRPKRLPPPITLKYGGLVRPFIPPYQLMNMNNGNYKGLRNTFLRF
jgi:hypothetical protein